MVFVMGALLIIGAYFNWDWFMKMWWQADMVEILTRKGARIFYII
jgi:hypothetical protein